MCWKIRLFHELGEETTDLKFLTVMEIDFVFSLLKNWVVSCNVVKTRIEIEEISFEKRKSC